MSSELALIEADARETQEAWWRAEEEAAERDGLEMCASCLAFVKPDDLVFERCIDCWAELGRETHSYCNCQQCQPAADALGAEEGGRNGE